MFIIAFCREILLDTLRFSTTNIVSRYLSNATILNSKHSNKIVVQYNEGSKKQMP